MKFNKKKKAFTLTELLVVVIIIGVLSAVVLPKFNKIIETRKTTEAEELMAAVRTEQEKRCAFDKPYLAEAEQLADILPSSSTKNFDYSFTNTGMIASSKGKYGYELKMPSYADGRICCENETECLKLNKDYPLCSELIAKTDYDDGTACEAEETVSGEEPTCSKKSYEESCPAGQTGKIIYTVNSNCEYEVTNTCEVITTTTECVGAKPANNQICNECGYQFRTVSCNTSTGQWESTEWGKCSVIDSKYCNCYSHAYDLGLGAFPDYGSCCSISGELIDRATGKVSSIEQSNSGLCCDPDCSNAKVYDDGSRMGCTCRSGGSSGGGSSNPTCPNPSSFEKVADCGASTCSDMNFDPCNQGCCNCSISVSSSKIVSDDNGCLIKGTVYYQ